MSLAWLSLSLFAAIARPADAQSSSANPEATKLHVLFQDEWQWALREYPEFATFIGDPRYNDKLTDLSVQAMQWRKAHERELLERIGQVDRARLTGQDTLSYDLFRRAAEQSVSLQRFPAGNVTLGGFTIPFEWMPISQMEGVHTDSPNYRGCPRYEPKLHETVPGHHLQIARAQELKGLPEFRRNTFYSAYSEGWGLYSESLGEELGLYKDPYSRFGRLQAEIFRACRLVVDTGMHSLGWTRQQAIDYMRENTGRSASFLTAEVDRYIVWPGQALGYKLGELKIKELRAKATKALGSKFDVRTFHNAVIDDGPLPLDLLDQRIDEWIRRQR